MNEFNVIDKCSTLTELEKEMNNWYQLPFSFRMRANDECMRVNGCTVPDYYEQQKQELSIDTTTESAALSMINNPRFSDQKLKSAQFANSPFIIIIDPDDNKEEVVRKFDSFLFLSDRNKQLSNGYSYAIWGYDVYNMKDIVLAKFDDTFKITESKSDLYTKDLCNMIELANIQGKIFDQIAFKRADIYGGVYEKYLVERAVHSMDKDMILTKTDDHLQYPTAVPYFTPGEIREQGIEIDIDLNKSYSKQLKEAKTEEDYLKLGWNPSLEINEFTLFNARVRQAKEQNLSNVYDVQDVRISENVEVVVKYKMNPVFMVFGENNHIAISFSSNLDILHEFVGFNETFSGFNKIYREDLAKNYYNMEVVIAFVEPEVYKEIKDRCENSDDLDINGFKTIYSVLLKARNKFDPRARKVLYSNCIEHLLMLINHKMDTDETYRLNEHNNMYKVFDGPYEDYDKNRVDSIINLLCDKKNIEITLSENYFINGDNLDMYSGIINPDTTIYKFSEKD